MYRDITFAFFLFLFIFAQTGTYAGTYFAVDYEVSNGNIIPFAIVHPPGYDGSGADLQIDICVLKTFPDSEKLVGPLQEAIETWNQQVPKTGNCQSCVLWEEAPPPGNLHAGTVLLHELGHCALGLGHINLEGAPFVLPSSFTKSIGATEVVDGNGLRGDYEDIHQIPVQVHDLTWFRTADNDPVIIDSTVIDINTFSRSVAADLPAGHNYAASANRAVAEALGFADTQAVMYSRGVPQMEYSGLSADDFNMVRMGMTGEDLLAGTADDYTVHLRYRANCDDDVEIRVELFPLGPDGVGICDAKIVESFVQGLLKFHWTVVREDGAPAIQISLNEEHSWDYGERIFASGFENGDLSEWSTAAP